MFFYLAMAAVAVLTWVGQRFGWPILVMIAGWIKGAADKDGDGKPDVSTVPAVTAASKTEVQTKPPTFGEFVSLANGETVALPLWLSVLFLLAPQLLAILQDALASLYASRGEPLSDKDKVEVAVKIGRDYLFKQARFQALASEVAEQASVPPG